MKLTLSIIFTFIFTLCSLAQETNGNIEITVTDIMGAVVPNASITIASSNTTENITGRFLRRLLTNEKGVIRTVDIPHGVYKITIEAISFDKRVFDGIKILAGKTIPIKLDFGVQKGSTVVTSSSIPEGKIVVYIYATARDDYLGQGKPSVFIDGRERAQISPSRYILAVVNPGKHIINFNKSEKNGIEAEFKHGQIYYLRLDWKKGKRLRLKNAVFVSKETANIPQLKMIEESDVKDKQLVITRFEG